MALTLGATCEPRSVCPLTEASPLHMYHLDHTQQRKMADRLMTSVSQCLHNLTSKLSFSPSSEGKPSPDCRFQFMSDLHLELGRQYATYDFPVTAPFLILAGDIGCLSHYDEYLSFLQRQTVRYKRVFLVLGNHEYYHLSRSAGLEKARQMEKEPVLAGKVTLLQQDSYTIPEQPDVTLLGCTLWSFIPREASAAISSVMNDFKHIEGWTVDAQNEVHAADLAWLHKEVEMIRRDAKQQGSSKRTVVVVTHHAPLTAGTSSPSHKGSPLNAAFATNVCESGNWQPVRYWVFGHTHWTTGIETNGVRVVANQRGHVFSPGKNLDSKLEKRPVEHTFDPARVIEV
ncbi:Metallo-dependent phosphatase-like protein [Cercophora scortea]|uniref:Metallo-dependent phosphatase-like protein n=1 Tax=Cercophora scortea TaxID=314031 RepID=A0AAE0IV58_9PEZI|nr:Metallo-dependent phosphatase-like protein [Cercophora scortea]